MEQKKIWDYFQVENKVRFIWENSIPRYKFIARFIKPEEVILNIGVGCGGLEKILLDKGCKVSTLDPSQQAIDKIRESLHLGQNAKVGYSQDIPFGDNVFDCVVMTEVLEHLSDEILATTLDEVWRVLRPKGLFLGTVPANEDLLSGEVVCPYCGKVFHKWGHVQSFDEERLRKLLLRKFRNVSIYRHYFVNLSSLNWKGKLTSLLKKWLLSIGVVGSDTTFFFRAYK